MKIKLRNCSFILYSWKEYLYLQHTCPLSDFYAYLNIFGDTTFLATLPLSMLQKKGEPCLFLSINNLYGAMLFYPIAITFFLKRFQCCKKKQIYNKKKTTTKWMTKFNCKKVISTLLRYCVEKYFSAHPSHTSCEPFISPK